MSGPDSACLPPHLDEYLQVLWRRKWIVAIAVVAGALAGTIHSVRQPARYEASASVILHSSNVASTLVNRPTFRGDTIPLGATAAQLARSPQLARRVVAMAHVDRSSEELLANSTATALWPGDVVGLSVRDKSPEVAAQLAATYAHEYASFLRAVVTKPLRGAIQKLEAQLARVQRVSPRYAQLADVRSALQLATTLSETPATPVTSAIQAAKIEPTPKLAVMLGGLVGLVSGLALAFLYDALDDRPRSEEEVEESFGAPLIGRIPAPLRPLHSGELVMLDDTRSLTAEAFRQLRARLGIAKSETHARTLLVTSAVEREGKTTIAANLAVAFARVGERVILVDLDLRQPSLHRAFAARVAPGVADVIAGSATLDMALNPIPIADSDHVHGTAWADGPGLRRPPLKLLPAGLTRADPGDFLDGDLLRQLLEALRERADVVVIDSPPLLPFGDTMMLTRHVDAVLPVVRIGHTRRASLARFAHELRSSRAATCGYVAILGTMPRDLSRDLSDETDRAHRRSAA